MLRAVTCSLAFAFLGPPSHGLGQSVALVSVSPVRLVEGDGRARTVEIRAVSAPASQVTLNVFYRPDRAALDSPPELFIRAFKVRDGNFQLDRDSTAGQIRAELPKRFDRVGVYWIIAAAGGGMLSVVHEPRPSSRSTPLRSFPERLVARLLSASGSGFRGPAMDRLSENPAATSIWIAALPALGRLVDETSIAPVVPAAMMPTWSPDGTRLAYTGWRNGQWAIAASRVNPGSGSTEIWHWQSHDQTTGDFSPTWSPDGRRIAFVRRAPDQKTDVWTLHLNGSGQPVEETRLTRIGVVRQVIGWDVEREIIFEALTSVLGQPASQLWTVRANAEGGTQLPQQLALAVPAASLEAHVPSRGSYIRAEEVPGEGGSRSLSQLYEATEKGELHRLITGERWSDRWPVVSSDARWLAFDSNRLKPR